MKQIFSAAIICIAALSACTTPFKKAKDGAQYKIVSVKKGAKLVTGNYMEMSVVAKYKDSLLFSTSDEGMPQYGVYDTTNFPMPFKEVFQNVHVGDSIIIKISADSLIAKGQNAPFMKKGQFIYQSYTILNVYTTKEAADEAQKKFIPAAKEKARKKQLEQIEKDLLTNKATIEKDSKLIDEYLAKNNIKATKTKWGTYIAVQTEGTGNNLTPADVATVNYTGKTFDSSKVFDSNTDPAFKHVQPYDVNLGQFSGIILGWPDALLNMKKGTKATLYIPSSLAYGKDGRQPEIKPDAILVFDMEVVGVSNEAEMMAKQEAMQKQQMEAQQRMMDSMQKAAPQPKK
jgi:FKBP-type peptidyl-prolyl cis-trans isomerase FkpA